MAQNNCWRHFWALMRKNFILWYRTPGCSTFEVLAPVVMMIALTIIRMQIPTSPVDQEGMFKKKYIVYPGVPPITPGTWEGSTHNCNLINDKVSAMTCYSDYTERHDKDNCVDYDVAYDWYGP